ncbi:NAD-dependent epimerase/dehydratase family protein [Halopiger goleimassiliensis]|uniref:NAD-dependent epimerase/dehydratase family protein n=1 Tax=Halopiger goleimassiliensis TaxID=1293048 RepID=UPI0006780F02|nr:NAD-dependent epimerase/dehydratase family protein [Halopiger goleimassiliensis]
MREVVRSTQAAHETLADRSILITGGAGFVGSHIASRLPEASEVRVLDAFTTGRPENVPDDATIVEGDVRDDDVVAEALEGIDLVFHEAALVSVERSVAAPATSHRINADATLRLLEAARDHDARVVLASSAAIYGQPETVPIPESAPKEPASPYGLDKLTIDHYARLYHELYGLETVALRYFNVYGPGQTAGEYSGVISAFVDKALAGEDITVHGDGGQTRDFVYVEDVVQANRKAAVTDHVGTAYNVGSGESISIRELAELVREVTDSDSDIVHVDGRTGDIEHSEADISKARDGLEYEPTVSIREGLERTVEWYRTRES